MYGAEKSDARAWSLDHALEHVAHWLPSQGPIKDFIHHNTLHAFQNRPFADAVAVAGELYGSRSYLPVGWYRQAYEEGRIRESALRRVADARGIPAEQWRAWLQRLAEAKVDGSPPPGRINTGLRAARRRRQRVDLDALVQPLVFRLLSSYLDQGVAIWRMPHARDSFWAAVQRVLGESLLPVAPFHDPECRKLLGGTCEAAIEACLRRLVGDVALFDEYLLELCLAHPGWSGMVAQLEALPRALLAPRPVRLREVIALELVCELGWMLRHEGADFAPLGSYVTSVPPLPDKMQPAADADRAAARDWNEALEWTLYESVFVALQRYGGRGGEKRPAPRIQTFHCIDDRECSLRRYLEETDPTIETYATAGFFGLDFLFQAVGTAFPVQHCPVVLTPKHLVREVPRETRTLRKPRLRQLLHQSPSSNTLFRGWLITQTAGLTSALRLAWNVLRPGARLLTDRSLTETSVPTEFTLLREGDARSEEGHLLGYSFDEMTDRVSNVLRSTGLSKGFCKLILFFGHGASSANNPHFAAYDCGACSGRPGAPNARAFAWMANHPQVRARLKERGLELPPDVHFVGGIHDTTRDEITYFDLERLPASHRALFEEFRANMEVALGHNARERCLRFELAPADPTPAEARAHVRERATGIFEPRPELNHATNALCFVGRRDLTRGLFFNRRAFLNSYDPTQDPKGDTLAAILNAVIPVCAGINLEYFFSRVDNEVYGAGSKLPHNVMSLLGVANGVEGDLRTGLPSQMIEVHDPVRLLLIVEQEPDVALSAVSRNPANYEWVNNDWVKYACFSPTTRTIHLFDNGRMAPLTDLPSDLDIPRAETSQDVVRQGRSFDVHVLGERT